MSTVIDSLVPY